MKLLGTSASLLVTSALLLVTMNKKLLGTPCGACAYVFYKWPKAQRSAFAQNSRRHDLEFH